ncbi:MAG: imidazoleglycerol-phosphate dehydratase HisB [Peptococcaceae bacterium]|nr:imidazoleglycerol-phosphate dehydratase HisB [Peptococcaceae bacterium]
MRTSQIQRETHETAIGVNLNLDGAGTSVVDTGIGFLDHMLTLLAKMGQIDVTLKAKGDLNVDAHHTIEDVGIVLGKAINRAAGEREGITRYGAAFVPMDEALVQVVLDFSNRPFLVWDVPLPYGQVGEFPLEMAEEFMRALAFNAGITLHIRLLSGKNTHHILEAIFKALGRALREALTVDPKLKGVLSTKGML